MLPKLELSCLNTVTFHLYSNPIYTRFQIDLSKLDSATQATLVIKPQATFILIVVNYFLVFQDLNILVSKFIAQTRDQRTEWTLADNWISRMSGRFQNLFNFANSHSY